MTFENRPVTPSSSSASAIWRVLSAGETSKKVAEAGAEPSGTTCRATPGLRFGSATAPPGSTTAKNGEPPPKVSLLVSSRSAWASPSQRSAWSVAVAPAAKAGALSSTR